MGNHTQRMVLALSAYFVGVLVLALLIFVFSRAQYLREVDARLLAAAENIPQILPADFHDRANQEHAISRLEDQTNLERLSQHAATGGFAYLYTYVVRPGITLHNGQPQTVDMAYFTASSYTSDDVANNSVSTYWTAYPEGPPEFVAAMSAKAPIFVSNTDRWGTFRTILVPMIAPGGNRYVAAADLDISVIDEALWLRVLIVFGFGVVMLILALPLVLVFRKSYADMNAELVQLTQRLSVDLQQSKRGEEELREARDAANAANACKSQFLANMSHEIRTPLNGIIGVTELLQLTELTPQQQEYIEVTRRSSAVLLETINQILDFSALEHGQLRLHMDATEMPVFAEELCQLFAATLATQALDLVLRLDTSVPEWLLIDRVHVRQILINLIGNALKFTEHGGVAISLSWRDGVLHGVVEDTGIGIAPDSQHLIFEPFQQADNSSTRRYSGTGLGLPLARALCQRMGGVLYLDRSNARGSVFIFNIAASALPAPDAEKKSVARMPDRLPRHVLMMTAFPAQAGFIADCCAHWQIGAQAFAHIDDLLSAARSGDVVLIDTNVLQREHGGVEHAANDESSSETAQPNALSRAALVDCVGRLRGAGIDVLLLDWYDGMAESLMPAAEKSGAAVQGRLQIVHKPLTRRALHSALLALTMPGAGGSGAADEVSAAPRPSILIVEDNAINRLALTRMLATAGLLSECCENGIEAVAACSAHDYALVLMDIQMPGMDGLEATRQIRAQLGDRAPVIIGVSAHVFPEHIAEAKAAGMQDYLGKPLRRDDLLNVVRRVLAAVQI